MNRGRNNLGFSLTEVLIATGIMAVGLVMVATIFPVGVKLTTLMTERTVGAVVADEAFAKIQLYGLRDFVYWPSSLINAPGYTDPTETTYETCNDFQYISNFDSNGDGLVNVLDVMPSNWSDFLYPSTVVSAGQEQNYYWSALCRRVSAKEVQVTVFVTRKIAAASQYREWAFTPGTGYFVNSVCPWPKPVKIEVNFNPVNLKELVPDFTAPINTAWGTLVPPDAQRVLSFIDDGYTIVDDYSGNKYRVLDVDRTNNVITLQQEWVVDPLKPAGSQDAIWVVPPAVRSDRYPCVGVYQRVLRFDEIK